MSFLPRLTETAAGRPVQVAFRGYNNTLTVGEDEFSFTEKITLGHYPVLSPRPAMGKYENAFSPETEGGLERCRGMLDMDGLVYVRGNSIYVKGVKLDGYAVADSPKQLVKMGARVLIWPDKVLLNTETMTVEDLGAKAEDVSASFTLSRVDGTSYQGVTASDTAPSDPNNNTYWLDTSDNENHVLKVYSSALNMWSPVGTTYVKIQAAALGTLFQQGDGVSITGVDHAAFTRAGTDYVVAGAGDGWIVVTGVIDAGFTDVVTVERRIPDMDFLVQHNNRVWGCSSANREVYACKQGDPKNWYCYAGVSTDSYAATIGSPGAFTGAAVYGGAVLFFKDDCVHKIFGNVPANFQIVEERLRGVKAGCHKSLAQVDEVLYYQSRRGIMAYGGGPPLLVSEKLGRVRYGGGVAGALNDEYFISMEDEGEPGSWVTFVYNTTRNAWLRDSAGHFHEMCAGQGNLFMVDADTGHMYTRNGTLDERYPATLYGPEIDMYWTARTGDFLMDDPDKGYLGRIQLRVQLIDADAEINVGIRYDAGQLNAEWVSKITGTGKRVVNVPIIPRRCDHFSIELGGRGNSKVFLLAKVLERGTEM